VASQRHSRSPDTRHPVVSTTSTEVVGHAYELLVYRYQVRAGAVLGGLAARSRCHWGPEAGHLSSPGSTAPGTCPSQSPLPVPTGPDELVIHAMGLRRSTTQELGIPQNRGGIA